MVVVDLGEIPAERMDAELLGSLGPYGSKTKPGALKRADGGTLVVNGVERLPLTVQKRLSTLLDAGQLLEPPFEDEDFLDVKLVATSSADLAAKVRAAEFLDEFHRRLTIIEVGVTPLAARIDEILPLSLHFLASEAKVPGRNLSTIAPAAERLLLEYPWPGNVAELRQCISSAARGRASGPLTVADLPVHVRDFGRQQSYQAAEDFLKR
jgi:DNA-binding NtrC family response regulator